MIRVIKKIDEWKQLRNSEFFIDKKIGFVPTMGALHEAHASLIRKSWNENDITVVSIFINPTQFYDPDDFINYPITYDEDLKILNDESVDYLFYPEYQSLYPDNYKYKIVETEFSKILCGASRPGHFDGVLSVVMKLFNIIRPHKAYFGEKDYQQLKLIEGMVKAFFMDLKIIACPIVRAENGLALSSRNKRLSNNSQITASEFPLLLKQNLSVDQIKIQLEEKGFKVDYITELNGRRFGAVYLNNVRLIDNVEI
ncbi:MAG: pantoate--beta-alanine ligase [Bacteroidota bacterium]|jgi:pantoate--beta-alanine ligase